jgi:CubicO group peptidase (beta-lactamase class C family)
MKEIVESSTNESLDRYVNNSFYKPMGMTSACFNPRNHIKLKDIVPTENDNYFRHQLVHGYVHDPGAAMLGGVSGHAGLFANANDMAKLMQMLLQKGYYGGTQYIKPETVEQFTKQQFPLNENRRGIGFDKPLPDDRDQGPTCASATLKSFGHSGFTGTYVWVDPEYNLVYIFLSNRINPTAKNTKLIKMDTRTKIQQIIYDAIGTSSEADREEVTANALKE